MLALIRRLVERRERGSFLPETKRTLEKAMQSDTVQQTIQQTMRSWERDPTSAKASPSVTGRSEGSAARLEAGAFSWQTDLPPALGGGNTAPSPTALLLSALAGCAVVFIRDTLAPQLGVQVTSVTAKAQCDTDARGLLGVGNAAPDLTNVRLSVQIESPDEPAAVRRLEEAWRERCPIYLALVKPTAVQVAFEHSAASAPV